MLSHLSWTSSPTLSFETETMMVLPSFLLDDYVVFTMTYGSAAQLVDHLAALWLISEDGQMAAAVVSMTAPHAVAS